MKCVKKRRTLQSVVNVHSSFLRCVGKFNNGLDLMLAPGETSLVWSLIGVEELPLSLECEMACEGNR